MENLHFEKFDFPHCFLDYDEDKKECDAKISKIKDESFSYRNDEFDVDLVIGSKKMFLTVYSRKKDLQKGISEKIFKFCEFEESL